VSTLKAKEVGEIVAPLLLAYYYCRDPHFHTQIAEAIKKLLFHWYPSKVLLKNEYKEFLEELIKRGVPLGIIVELDLAPWFPGNPEVAEAEDFLQVKVFVDPITKKRIIGLNKNGELLVEVMASLLKPMQHYPIGISLLDFDKF